MSKSTEEEEGGLFCPFRKHQGGWGACVRSSTENSTKKYNFWTLPFFIWIFGMFKSLDNCYSDGSIGKEIYKNQAVRFYTVMIYRVDLD